MKLKIKFDEKNTRQLGVIMVIVGMLIFGVNVALFRGSAQLTAALNLVAGILGIGGPVFLYYRRVNKLKKVEDKIPIFLGDLNQNIKSGMTLPQALKHVQKNSYGILDPYVKDMAAKIDWGISFEKILQDFAKKVPTQVIRRTVATVIEAHKSGGDIVTVLESVIESTKQIEKIKKERLTEIYSQLVNGYIIFFVFLGVMFGLAKFLLPAFRVGISDTGGFDAMIQEVLFYLILIQGFFAGLSIGKLSEGTFVAGLKHSLILLTVGYTVYVIFI